MYRSAIQLTPQTDKTTRDHRSRHVPPRHLSQAYSPLVRILDGLSLARAPVHVESPLGLDEVADRLREATDTAAFIGQGGTNLWSGRVGPGNRAMLSRASRPPLGWFLASYLSVRLRAVEEGTRITGKVGLHPLPCGAGESGCWVPPREWWHSEWFRFARWYEGRRTPGMA